MDSVKFAELVAKTGRAFGEVDGYFDADEKNFVNLFVGFLKAHSNFNGDVNEVISKANSSVCTIPQLIEETKVVLADLSADQRKATIQSMASFIETVIKKDGNVAPSEARNFEAWKSALM